MRSELFETNVLVGSAVVATTLDVTLPSAQPSPRATSPLPP